MIRQTPTDFVLAKNLEDGSTALGLFNLSDETRTVSADWAELKLKGRMSVRNVWRQKNVGYARGVYSAPVAGHSVMLVRLVP